MHELIELEENQLRELVNARSTLGSFLDARRAAQQHRGSMVWRTTKGHEYLVRKSATGAQKSLGPRSEETEKIFDDFWARKNRSQERLKAMRLRMDEQHKLNRVYGVGRTPAVVVRILAALEEAGLADKFMVIGTHAMYAYETAAGVRVQSQVLATRDLDLLFDARRRLAFMADLDRTQEKSLIRVFQRADRTFTVMPSQKQTAVNDTGFEIDVVRRQAVNDGDEHPMRMSADEEDFWAVQIDQGEKLGSGRRFEHVVIAPAGEMAIMRTVHPLDFVRLKTALGGRPGRDPLKGPKDLAQAQAVKQLWDEYLRHAGDQAQSSSGP